MRTIDADHHIASTRAPGAGWTTLHAYVHDAAVADRLITEVVGPVGRAMERSGEISSQFFLRYWDGGPHVRWRLRDADDTVVARAAGALEEFLHGHAPASPVDPAVFLAGMGQPPEGSDWFGHGTVNRVDYEPETDRYGGPAALTLAEELFAVSSRLAESVVKGTVAGPQRVALALDLAHALLAGADVDGPEAARFLRGFVLGWPTLAEAPNVDLDAARHAAERDLLTAPAAHAARREVVRRRVQEGTGAVGLWGAAVARYVRGLQALDSSGELTTPIPWVLGSQLHMMHNRLGLTISDECHLSWLASFPYLGVDHSGGMHPPAPDAPDRVYHERSKFFPARGAAQFPDPDAPLHRNAVVGTGEIVQLPRPEPGGAGQVALLSALLNRRSAYGRYHGQLTSGQLSTLLWYSAGDVDELRPPGAGPEDAYPVRPYPSAGARSATRLLVQVAHIDGIPSGLYEYRPSGHALERVPVPTRTADLLRCSPFLDPDGQPTVDAVDAPAFLAVVADLAYPRQRYGLRSLRFQLLEAGHLTQNLLLVGAALGLRSVPLGGIYDDRLSLALGLDGVDDAPLYLVPLGHEGWDPTEGDIA
ncbi:thiopeptide-type bacteriocin biosynthesis protein [Ornithinimicrobium pratense]|uniref:SagB/ThcOx family dehydrogenase n=1 Tax=Ornithinimicrobium pratense TaxID=2593973 RepID=A0A5J6V6N9_9MICO|nr:thiopeptide-type bacteriocin biosynthesis protein [Ornithinimicrobium pratense]QFG69445.1 SagB/ThcOx family dehydrogenase [Ornithinimicrobium pratense]